MLRKVKISMKVKILSILIVVLMTSLSLYLFFALDMFVKDKTAYIYETSLSTAESLSEHMTSMLNRNFQNSFTLATTGTKNPKQLQKIIDLDANLLMFSVFKNKPKAKEVKRTINKKLSKSYQTQYSLPEFFIRDVDGEEFFFPEKLKDKPFLVFNATEIFKLPSLIFTTYNKKSDEYYVSLLGLSKLEAQFHKDPIYSNYLLDEVGGSFFEKDGKVVKTDAEKYVQDIVSSSMSRGTKEVMSADGEQRIVSFQKLGDFNLLVLTEIPKEKAFTASRYLVKKSILFGTMLLGVAVFIGVLFSVSITNPIKSLLFGTQEVATGNFTHEIAVKTNDELGVLSDSFNFMSGEINRLMQETAQKARMEKELETAQTVQETLFPELNATIGNVQISGYYEPASECGGDWWNYSDVGDKVFFWIGDATGHGVPAALITSAARSAASIIETMPQIKPSFAMTLLNKAICSTSRGRMLMTFFLASYDKATGELTYANASQNPPFLFKYNDEKLKIKSFVPLDEVNGPRLGQNEDAVFEEYSMHIEKDDAILFYTDGITELENESATQWGERKFLKAFIECVKNNEQPEQVISAFMQKINDYRGTAEFADDITYYMCKIN